jgi:hypothetical protein
MRKTLKPGMKGTGEFLSLAHMALTFGDGVEEAVEVSARTFPRAEATGDFYGENATYKLDPSVSNL